MAKIRRLAFNESNFKTRFISDTLAFQTTSGYVSQEENDPGHSGFSVYSPKIGLMNEDYIPVIRLAVVQNVNTNEIQRKVIHQIKRTATPRIPQNSPFCGKSLRPIWFRNN